jgi:molybdenum cofactor cytidylyltransferase
MTGAIILAAGSSSRLGSPKQNLVYKGRTLLQRTVETVLASICRPVIVVLGAHSEVVKPTLAGYDVTIIENKEWAEGMASSIRAGVNALKLTNPDIPELMLLLSDQPMIDTSLLNMLALAKSRDGIVASAYNGTLGPPALFDKVYLDDLLALKGHEGAKKVIHHYPHAVTEIPFPAASMDIDTVEDYERIKG